jgi:hypothetical protein
VKDRSTIRQILNGTFEEQHDCWWDWFCTDRALVSKTKKLVGALRQIVLSPKIDIDKQYVFFKNNCPCYGDNKLYDDFRICDIKTGDVVYTIIPRDPFGKALVYAVKQWRDNTARTDNMEPVVKGNWEDVVKFFNATE